VFLPDSLLFGCVFWLELFFFALLAAVTYRTSRAVRKEGE
jgi:hypothetical protein